MNKEKKVLIVDDEESMRHMLSVMLEHEGYCVETASDGKEALQKARREEFNFILCDVRMPKMDGMALLKRHQEEGLSSTVIMMSAYGTIDTAVEAMKFGAYDYISKPFKADEVILTLCKAEERERLARENIQLREEIETLSAKGKIITSNPKMQEVLHLVTRVADLNSTVLISGESGTGKELVARAVHHQGMRGEAPFVAVNCGAIPENLLETEMFGHARGAFTDARQERKGLFEEADGGTLFLDEVGELPLSLQVKLLRVLQEGDVRRVGENRSRGVDVRVITATAKDLEEEVRQGNFREDLYYRLNVISLSLPPLRERPEDIDLLVRHFIQKNNTRLGKQIQGMDDDAQRLLSQYHWPGNVRELENAVEQAMVLTDGPLVLPQALSLKITEPPVSVHLPGEEEYSVKKATQALEEHLIRKALKTTNGNRTRAAKLLEISLRSLLYKIKAYRIE